MDQTLIDMQNFLLTIPNGDIADEMKDRLTLLLYSAWDKIEGSSFQNTTNDKVLRLESPVYDKPMLYFVIERHGPTVNGSSRAPLHKWSINTSTWSANVDTTSFRQLRKLGKRLDTMKLAKEIKKLIDGMVENDKRISWDENKNKAFINMSEAIPGDASNQTVAGRRRRFRENLWAVFDNDELWTLEEKSNRRLFVIKK